VVCHRGKLWQFVAPSWYHRGKATMIGHDPLSMDGFSSNSLWTYYKSPQVAWAAYFSCALRMRATRAWLSIRLSLDGFSPNLVKTYYRSPQIAWVNYLLLITTRMCMLAHLWTDSLQIWWGNTTDHPPPLHTIPLQVSGLFPKLFSLVIARHGLGSV
jgi:hypothetical protein